MKRELSEIVTHAELFSTRIKIETGKPNGFIK